MFVSHNVGSVSELCTTAILLHKGQIVTSGRTSDVIGSYAKLIAQESAHLTVRKDATGYHADLVSIAAVTTHRADEVEETVFDFNDEVVIQVDYEVHQPLETLQLAMVVSRNMGELFSAFDTDGLESPLVRCEPGRYRAQLRIPPRFLKAGGYSIAVNLGTISSLLLDVPSAGQFMVEELSENTAFRSYKKERLGSVICPGTWTTVPLS